MKHGSDVLAMCQGLRFFFVLVTFRKADPQAMNLCFGNAIISSRKLKSQPSIVSTSASIASSESFDSER